MVKLNYKFMFFILLGFTVGLAVVADDVINEAIDLVNECRVEKHKLEYPQAYKQETMRNEAVADFLKNYNELQE